MSDLRYHRLLKMQENRATGNIDAATIQGFGKQWNAFDQTHLSDSERLEIFQQYFRLIKWSPKPRRVLDMGCGSGRWSELAAPLVEELVAAEASAAALAVAMRNVRAPNLSFVQCTPDSLPYPDNYFDLIFALGVLHHVPDTKAGIRFLAAKLAPGGTLLLYLYYALENRPLWFRGLWRVTDLMRRVISRLPFAVRYVISQAIATSVYWPLARVAKYFRVPSSWPLKIYANRSFYVMRTDALDRFGTRLEKRFSRTEICEMLAAAGLCEVSFSPTEPYWICAARKMSDGVPA